MIYNGYFRQVKTDDLYTVRLTTSDGKSQSKEITLGGSPFTTEMDESGDTIYKPCKYQTATTEVVTADYLFDIYSSRAQDTKIELLKGDDVMFVGYVRPNLYDMGFEKRRETIQIECSDALSTLQYIPYSTDSKKTRSFYYIINKLIKACNAYKGFYISDSIQLDSASATNTLIDKLYISESNFFEEKDENETDKDVAWKCNEVLEEICRYLGLTCIADKEYVWFLDYDAIKNGNNYYWYYNIDGGTGTRIEMNYSKAVVAKDYSSSGATISLDNVYNKVTVKDSLYDYDSVIPSLYDNLTNITSDTDEYVTTQSTKKRGEIVKTTLGDTENKNMILLVDDSGLVGQFAAVKYYTNPNYKLFTYKNGVQNTYTTLNYTDTTTMHGAFICKCYTLQVEGGVIYNILNIDTKDLDTLLADNSITSISLSNYVGLINYPDDYYISNDDITKYPYIQTSVTDTSALYGGDNTYLIISGSYWYSSLVLDNKVQSLPYSYEGITSKNDGYHASADDYHLTCKLQWGNKYWNGYEWTTTDSTFNLPYLKSTADIDEQRVKNTMWKDNEFRNNVSWRIGTSEKGYCIKCPTDTLMEGVPILTVYKPYDPDYHYGASDKGQAFKHLVVFLKDFDIQAVIGDPTFSDNNDTDTEYSMKIDDDYVSELSEISMKVNTFDYKKPCYSAVAYNDGTNYKWLNKVYNKSLSADVNGMQYINENNIYATSDGSLRNEWWLCYRLYKQYNKPSTIVKMNLRNDGEVYGLYTIHDLDGKEFILDSVNKDYQNNSAEYKFIEKK